MHTINRITVRATPQAMYDLATNIVRWPELLPHYRYVRVLEHGPQSRQAKMGARRWLFPVSWTSTQELFPEEQIICYHHTAGVTKGMDVRWHIQEVESVLEVTIEHWLEKPGLLLRWRVLRELVGRVFVMPIADRTLHGLKQHAERITAEPPM